MVHEEQTKTNEKRWAEATDLKPMLASPLRLAVGGMVGLVAGGAAPSTNLSFPFAVAGLLLSNFVIASVLDDLPTVDGVVQAVGTVARNSPLDPAAADTFGLSSQELYDLARTVHTRGVPQVGVARPIRPPL